MKANFALLLPVMVMAFSLGQKSGLLAVIQGLIGLVLLVEIYRWLLRHGDE